MPLESGTTIDALNSSNPAATDGLGQADDHIRLVKAVLKGTFPNWTTALTATAAQVDAAVTAIVTGPIKAPANGSGSAPAYTWGTELSLGWYRAGAGDMRAAAGGADVLKIAANTLDLLGTTALKRAGTNVFPLVAADIGTDAVTTVKVQNDAVTYAKIQNVSTNNKLLGRSTAGAGDVEEIGLGSGLVLSGGNLTAPSTPIPGAFKNLSIVVASNTTVTCSADFVTMTDGTNFRTVACSGTVDLGSNGAVNKLDTGTIAIDQWYFIWAISNGTTDGWLASLSATAPTMPAGYTYKARYGAVRTIHASATLFGTKQLGRKAQYVVGLAQTAALPSITSGSSGSVTVPTWTTVSVASIVPSTASRIQGVMKTNTSGGAGSHSAMLAANGSYGAAGSTTNPPIIVTQGYDMGSFGTAMHTEFDFELETLNVFYAADNSTSYVFCLGWEDNI